MISTSRTRRWVDDESVPKGAPGLPRTPWPPPGWPDGKISHRHHSHRYYTSPDQASNPTILLLHEFPGIGTNFSEFAQFLAQDFRVVVPSIVGRDGHPCQVGSGLSLCIRREVNFFATSASSPALPWLRELINTVVSPDYRRFGVIGMCMTGGFALALAVDPRVVAAVAAQPALPITRLIPQLPMPGEAKRSAALGVTRDVCERLTRRTNDQQEANLRVRGYRFRDDWRSPAPRMIRLADLLGAGAKTFPELDDPSPTEHSTLTGGDHSPQARADVVKFLHDRLGPAR